MRIPRSPFEILSEQEERVRRCGRDDDSGRSRTPRRNILKGNAASKGDVNRRQTKSESTEPEDLNSLDSIYESKDLEEYKARRVFVFVHHFAGEDDPLSEAMKAHAESSGLRLKIHSVERETGSGDLLKDKPYEDHLLWAKRGHIDIYHAGFPCGTYTRLRFRSAPGLPRPVRTKSEPYGRKSNTEAEQRECDVGTILASRAITMAKTVANRNRPGKIQSIATLENPPPSDIEGHLSAWELAEMEEFTNDPKVSSVHFNTCCYESHLPVGKRHFKPQQFSGSMIGLKELKGECQCGGSSNHEFIVGKEKSRASGRYPGELCDKYAKLAVAQLDLMAKEEFLSIRREKLQKVIDEHKETKAKSESQSDYTYESSTTSQDEDQRDEGMPSREDLEGATLTATKAQTWVGSDGKHGMLRSRNVSSLEEEQNEYVGGMRNPHKSILGNSSLRSLGVRIRAAWETLVRKRPGTLKVAETYGTPHCSFDDKLVAEWRDTLKRVVGANAPPTLAIKGKYEYKSPLNAEIIEAWASKGGDKETEVPKWVRNGAPLGIQQPIKTCGIFPPADANDLNVTTEAELEDASAQMSKGSLVNYKSVLDDVDNAKVELDRYRDAGYLKDISEKEVRDTMGHGTISRLGLIVKEKPEGTKRRIIIDLRRSGGNQKAVLPERLTLPRPRDAVATVRDIYERRGQFHRQEGEVSREMAVIDIQDAFMSLGVAAEELPHTLTPSLVEGEYYCFCALLFGYKTAPLLWSRTAAMLARFQQSLLEGHEGQHLVYLDDGLWFLQGDLKTRNSNLAMVLTTAAALGFKVSLKKGERSTQVAWIGIRLTLTEDALIMGLPAKYMEELAAILKRWDGAGMASLKELRQVCGKVAWLAGILPKARWVVAVFYKVLHSRLADVKEGKEEKRRQSRKDQRDKSSMFHIKQLEQARLWMVAFMDSAMESPTKKFKLDTKKYPTASVITDASPEGIGAVLLVNNRIIRALKSPVLIGDAEQLKFPLGESASQGILEALAVLVAIKHWSRELATCSVTLHIQSDSLVALALTQRMASSSPSLNFIGAELAIACEAAGIEGLKATHIPGAANTTADYLSRPAKQRTMPLPAELEGVPVQTTAPRGQGFYALPTPGEATSLWASDLAAESAWATLR